MGNCKSSKNKVEPIDNKVIPKKSDKDVITRENAESSVGSVIDTIFNPHDLIPNTIAEEKIADDSSQKKKKPNKTINATNQTKIDEGQKAKER